MAGVRLISCAVLVGLSVSSVSAQWTATAIVRAGTFTAEPTTICVGNQGLQVKLTLDGFTSFVRDVTWELDGVGPDNVPIHQTFFNNVAFGDPIELPVTFGRVGEVNVTATVYYRPGPGLPAQPPHTLWTKFTVEPPDDVEILPRDEAEAYPFGQDFPLNMRLKHNGSYCGGFHMTPLETIHFSVPQDKWEADGNWIGDPAYLWIEPPTGNITDKKGWFTDQWPNNGVGSTFVQYEQTLGVRCATMAGNFIVIPVATFTCTFKRATGGEWTMSVTR